MAEASTKAGSILGAEYLRELESEITSTRECLKIVPVDKPDWKPHEKSMQLGYLAQLVADIPRWIQFMIEKAVIDFETYPQFKGTTNNALVQHFDEGSAAAKKVLGQVSDERLKETFELRRGDQLLISAPMDESICQAINHMVHHRGQLTVYLRMNGAAIPSIYGPSGDSGGF